MHAFEIDEVLKLLKTARAESEQDWLMILMTFLHALRAHEVVGGSVTWKNKKTGKKSTARFPGLSAANVVGTKLVVTRLKGSKPVEDELLVHENPLLNERPAVLALCRNTRPKQNLFPISARTFQRRMHYYGKLAGLPELYCHPHTLKHSVLTYLSDRMPLDKLQDRSGHVELGSLGMYLHPKKAVTEKLVNDAFASI
jgi:integrase